MKKPLVEKLEERLLPEFEEIAVEIRKKFSDVSVIVSSYSVGSGEFLGHGFAVSCLIIPSCDYETDFVDLCVSLSHLVDSPKIDAYVCWGHPSGHIEAEFLQNPVNSLKVTDEVLENLYESLPELYESFFEAIERRKPSNE